MNKVIVICLSVCILAVPITLAESDVVTGTDGIEKTNLAFEDQPFDSDWYFLRADAPGAELTEFDDSNWRILDVPQDWQLITIVSRAAVMRADFAYVRLCSGVISLSPGRLKALVFIEIGCCKSITQKRIDSMVKMAALSAGRKKNRAGHSRFKSLFFVC